MKAMLFYDINETLEGIYVLGHNMIGGEIKKAELIDIIVKEHINTPLSNCPLSDEQCVFYAKTILEQATTEKIFARGQVGGARGDAYPVYFNLWGEKLPPEAKDSDDISMPECNQSDEFSSAVTRIRFDDELVHELDEKLRV